MGRAASIPLLALAGVLAFGCKSDDEPFVVRVVAGLGEPPFGGEPTIGRIELRVRDLAGVERAIGDVTVPEGRLEVPDAAKSGVGSLVLAGIGADGSVLAYGRTPSLELTGLTGRATISLALFVERTAAMTSALKLPGPSVAPRCAAMGTRYALVADSEGTHVDVIDLLAFRAAREEAFVSPPAAIATAGSLMLTIERDGKATITDLGSGSRRIPEAPAGASFADVAFGATVHDENGGAWIVGPTRTTAPSDVAIRLGGDGAIVARKLLRARKSAAATWVNGRGLVIAYGDDGLGVELLAPGATASTALPFPADARAGGVLATLDTSRVLRIDQDGVGSTLDLTCAKDCAPAPTTLKDEPRGPRADDHATLLEGGGAVVVRGGRVLRLARDASKLELLHDAGSNAVCSTALSTGSVAVAIGGDDVLRTIAPAR